jgi:long-subunit acyl-CoA synthetase (AMP-forming)
LTAEAIMPDGFVRTGDRGEVDEMGRLKITGRVKEIFKTSKGKYVSPAPIENASPIRSSRRCASPVRAIRSPSPC